MIRTTMNYEAVRKMKIIKMHFTSLTGRKIIKFFFMTIVAAITLFLLFVLYYQIYEIYHYRNISGIRVIAVNQKKTNLNIPLKKSHRLSADKCLKIPIHAEDGPYWAEFNKSERNLRILSTRYTAFGTYVVHSCFEISDPTAKRKLIDMIEETQASEERPDGSF